MILALCVLGWLACAVLAYGIWFAHSQREYPTPTFGRDIARQDMGFSLFMGLVGGPFALLIVFCLSGFAQHGMLFWLPRQATADGNAGEKL